ncbi:hypothetical protein [Alkalithermobacter paradoxus]|uniref:Uncharacterized protein n=1 Tax=Alkalithermobacter paradoxus TaxID=29349 RepID=A0A1V4I9S0_9FIRM|nr:hypothetical protein CLOTH_00230 [[Clostridium] thermoalcaliphilum]
MKNLTKGQLQAIASECSQYEPQSQGFTSSLANSTSCESCSHYVNKKCSLDLIDDILDNMNQ